MRKVIGILGLFSVYSYLALITLSVMTLFYFIGYSGLSIINYSHNIFLNIVVGVGLFILLYSIYLKIKVKPLNKILMDKSEVTWINVVNIALTLLVSLIIVPYYFNSHDVNWGIVVFSLYYFALTSLPISTGYHRYFAHHSFKASPIVEWYLLLFSCANVYGPAIEWAGEHLEHHKHEDTEKDPHAVTKGFWNAHCGWIFYRKITLSERLKSNPRVMWQYRNIALLTLIMAFGVPTLIGFFLGSWVQGLLVAGFFRLCYFQHLGFFINSLGHYQGKRPYKGSSAVNNPILALIANGEGYHNNHHASPSSYTTKNKSSELDPSGWIVWWWKVMGLAEIKKKNN